MMLIRNAAWMALCVGLLAWPTPAFAWYESDYCQILDRMEEPIWHGYIGYASRAQIRGFKKTAMTEFGAGGGLLYFRTDFGEIDLKAAVDSILFTRSGGVELPGHISAARLNLSYVLRLDHGYAVRLGIEPGFYSEIEYISSDHIFYPFSLHGIHAITPDLSALAGLNFYPGFDRLIDPRVGVRWNISDYLLLDAFYPKTEIVFRPTLDWSARAGVEYRNNMEYHLKKRDDRKHLIMDETRLYFGVEKLITHQVQVMFQAGRLVNRSLDFRRFEREKDMDDAFFFRIGVGGVI